MKPTARHLTASLASALLASLVMACAARTTTEPDPQRTTKTTTTSPSTTTQDPVSPPNVDDGCAPALGPTGPAPTFPAATTVTATHSSATCDDDPKTYAPTDPLTVSITAPSTTVAGAVVTIGFTGEVAVGQQIPLNVPAPTAASDTQVASGSGITLTYVGGALGEQTEAEGLQAATVEVDALPTTDGQNLSVTLTLVFPDGQQVSQMFTEATTSAACTFAGSGG